MLNYQRVSRLVVVRIVSCSSPPNCYALEPDRCHLPRVDSCYCSSRGDPYINVFFRNTTCISYNGMETLLLAIVAQFPLCVRI